MRRARWYGGECPVARWLLLGLSVAALGGCESFPHDGPSIQAVRQDASRTGAHYRLVELDPRSEAIIASTPAAALAGLDEVASTARVDLIGTGDGLKVTIYERGSAALFSSGPSLSLTGGERAAADTIPLLLVDRAGDISMPFGGRVHVAGETVDGAAWSIEPSLRGKAVDPQAVVSVVQNVSNSVTIIGDVRSPGRYPLSEGDDRLLDVVAVAGGPTHASADIRLEISRGPITATIPLSQLLKDEQQNVRLAPRDQVRLVYQSRKFSTFGALGRAAEIPLEDEKVTLAAALSRTGGLDSRSADARSVLVFRFERPEVASALGVAAPPSPKGVPIIYLLNLRDPSGLFIANQFEIEPDDLIYVPRSNLTEVREFVDVVSAVSNVAYDVRVTSVVP